MMADSLVPLRRDQGGSATEGSGLVRDRAHVKLIIVEAGEFTEAPMCNESCINMILWFPLAGRTSRVTLV